MKKTRSKKSRDTVPLSKQSWRILSNVTQQYAGISCAKSLRENVPRKQGNGLSMRMKEKVFGSKNRGLLSKKDAKRGTLFAYGNVNNLGQVEC
jgi:hypothetical protein